MAPRVILECFGISGSGSFLLDCGDITRIRAASRINSGATIEARGQRPDLTECGGNIQLIQCDQGLRGAIVAPRGYIREITVNGTGSNGEILDQASPRTFPLIRARDGIRSISANSIDADISANSGGGNGVLGRLVTRSGNFTGNVAVQAIGKFDTAQSDAGVEIAGNLVGELCPRAGGITVPVRINGDVTSTGSIRVVGGPLVDDATRDGRLTIGGSMAGSISIEQAAGLQGQVVINANAGTGTWTGSVRIGPLGSQTTLTPAYYSNLSATLGGGAVGLVPFQQHDADCSPPQLTALPPPQLDPGDGRTVLSSALAHETPCVPGAYDPVSFTLVRYGPIFSPAGNAPAGPFEVFPANESTGAPIPGGHSLAGSFVFTDYNTSPGPPYKRSVTMHSGSPLPAGLYVVVAERQDGVGGPTPESAIVGPRCDALLTTSTVLADDFRYHFRVLSDCNRNGVADRDDIAADPGLDFFPVFGGTTCGISFLYGNCVIDTCEDQCQYVDLNNDGNLDQGDLDCFVAGVAGDLSCAPGWPQGALDLNNDGNVDQADIELMTSWVAGDCAVDPCE